MDLDVTADLIPVAQWKWPLYEVRFLDAGERLIKTDYLVSSSDNHIGADCNDMAQLLSACETFTWKPIRENVPAPLTIGHMYGIAISESGWAAGRRMHQQGA